MTSLPVTLLEQYAVTPAVTAHCLAGFKASPVVRTRRQAPGPWEGALHATQTVALCLVSTTAFCLKGHRACIVTHCFLRVGTPPHSPDNL